MQTSRQTDVELGVPYLAWPVREDLNYEFGLDDGRLSRELRSDLLAWAKLLSEHFDGERGWSSDEAHARFRTEGLRLLRSVQQELGPEYRVTLNTFAMS
ncbi:hypothetical protein [Arthrobacter sp. NPDC090010]|uniref:hypothetical protein n=1 Tax=Arthrobacter sp. NPDC090010 TaxID=3363942 RepID=UPI0037FCACA0